MAPSCAYLNGIEVKIEFNHTGVSRQSRKCTGTTIVSRQATHATGSYRDMSAQNRTFAYRPVAALAELAAPYLKLMHIRRYREAQPDRFDANLSALSKALYP